MTSNIGARALENNSKLGFGVADDEEKDRYDRVKDTVMEEMKKAFRPEFLNRLDDIIVFSNLTKPEIRQIVEIMLADLSKRLKAQDIDLEITEEVKDFISEEGYSQTYGARPLRRVIQRKIEDPIAEEILTGLYSAEDVIKLKLDNKKIVFTKGEPKEKTDEEDTVVESK